MKLASDRGHAAVVRALLERGADVNARSNRGRTALHSASWKGRAEALRELLMHRPDLNAQSNGGHTPLIEACSEGHLMAATLLIGAGADLALLNNAGRSALWWAEGRVTLDAAPSDAGAEPVTAARREEHARVVALLKLHGAP